MEEKSNLKDGLTERTKITQTEPRGADEKTQIPKAEHEAVKTDRGSFQIRT